MNRDLREPAKNDLVKYFLKLINDAAFWKNHVKCEKIQKYLACNNLNKKELYSIRAKLS